MQICGFTVQHRPSGFTKYSLFFKKKKHLVTRCCNCLKPDYNLHVWTLSCILLYDYLLLLRSTSVSVYTRLFAMFLNRYMGEVYNPSTDKTEVKSLLKRRLSPNSTFVLAYFLLLIYVCCPILEILVVKKKSVFSERKTNKHSLLSW